MPFDRSKFIEQFKNETKEHLEKLNLGFVKLEKTPQDKPLTDELMREAHTIKGSAAMMGYKRISDIAHKMEDAFGKIADGSAAPDSGRLNVLFKCLDAIGALLEDKVIWSKKGFERPYVDELCSEVDDAFSGKERPREAARKEQAPAPHPIDVRIDAPDIGGPKETTIRVDIEKLDKLMNLAGEQLISKIRLGELVKALTDKAEANEELDGSIGAVVRELNKTSDNIDVLSSGLQEQIMKVRMVPVSTLFNAFPRAMRDLAHSKSKDIVFELKGENTELDKSIIEEMKEPLMHLLRNAVDHGIETTEERIKKHKSIAGNITLSASHVGYQVIIEVADDGRGINPKVVKEAALKKKLASREKLDEMPDDQALQLIFSPGFSTKDDVTETSGRGVGLDVVRENIGRLKGMIEVVSDPDAGTRFIMKLPLTLAITESLIVTAGEEKFAIPVERVAETIRVDPDDIKSVETKEVVTVRGHILPLVRLSNVFNIPPKGIVEKTFFPIVVVQSVEKKVALLVDRLLGRQDIVSKSIGSPLGRIKNIAGATITGDGRVVLILDIPAIIELGEGVVTRKPSPAAKAAKGKKRKTILLVEDSLSTAMLEKNILESVGYSVVITRDGQEALERSSHEKFDLVITDILMPRMDGFELTTRLKKDKTYRDIPVIVVTTRESDDDKKRGLACGADAYILKSEFTSDALLDTIERLIG